MIRTNPVTGWKSVFAVGEHVHHVNDVTPWESKALLEWFVKLIVDNHDLQVRHRWQNPNDVAIWDNRSVYHAATPDYEGLGERLGHRVVSIGERPFLDVESKSRLEALRELSKEGNAEDGLSVSWSAHEIVLEIPDRSHMGPSPLLQLDSSFPYNTAFFLLFLPLIRDH